jgi:hypothetical protein
LKVIGVFLEVLEDWEWVVPDEEGVDLVEVAEASVVAFRVSQDVETEGDQFQFFEFGRPLLLSLFLLIVVKAE